MSISLLPEFDADGYQVEPSTEKLNEIITAINESGGGGGGDTYPMNPGIWYDNGTAGAGGYDGDVTIEPDVVSGSLIKVTDANATMTALGVLIGTGPASESTIRFALYAVSETGASRGLPGAKVGDLGTIVVDAEETGFLSVVVDQATPSGYYWIMSSATVSLEVRGWTTGDLDTGRGMIGVFDPTDSGYKPTATVNLASTGAQTAMPATFVGVVEPGDRDNAAPQVFFQVTPN